MYRDIPEEMRQLIEPVVEQSGHELVDVTLTRGPKPWQLRITIDTWKGDGRVPIDVCARVSREVESHLDAADAIPGSYRLEVSSPGLDRTLAREKDFRAACGEEVRIETRRPLEGRRRFRGRLVDFESGVATLSVDGREFGISFADVAKANKVYRFTRDDFSGEAARRSRSRNT